jgi:hypothetical protein
VIKLCDNEEEKKLATHALDTTYTLNEREAKKILETPRKRISESNIFNDLKLSRTERIQHAANILNSRK